MSGGCKKLLHCVIMGSPGGGKGTISKKILKDFKLHHVSTGDLLRKHVNLKTPLGLEAKSAMDRGELVSNELVFNMIKNEVSMDQALLIDGVPRAIAQVDELLKLLDVSLVLNLIIPHQVIINRISNRWIHSPSGRTYALDYNPPKVAGKDDVTGELLTQRIDDKPESVATRLDLYEKQTKPVLDVLRARGIPVADFHGSESDKIYPEVNKRLQALFASGK